MEKKSGRRGFLKYLFSLFTFGVVSIFSFRFKKDEGFQIGRRVDPLGPAEASAVCGAGLSCAGGGGQCGAGLNCAGGGGKCGAGLSCAGGQGDPPPIRYEFGGGGQCGAGLSCAGGGGQCGAGLNCAGGGGQCGAGLNCAGQ